MTIEEYAKEWLARQNFTKPIHKTTRQSVGYICDGIGAKEVSEIEEKDIDRIFENQRLFKRQADFTERTFRVLNNICDELREKELITSDPVLHIYDSVIFSHEKVILEHLDVELTARSPFVDVSCMWLKSKGYSKVTYELYYHFLNAFIHPFIGKKPIGLIDQNNIKRVYTYFNTVNTNETWITQIHLVMRMVFQYAIDNGLISTNPLLNIDDPHLEPILELDKNQRNAVRAAFGKYGFRKTKLKDLAKELYAILHEEENCENGVGRREITVSEVFSEWFSNTQEGVLAEATAGSSYHAMNIYVLPTLGNKPIKHVSLSDLKAVKSVYALMGNTADWYILAKLRSLYDYAVGKGYVSENIAYLLKSDNNTAAEKLVLTDKEIKDFLRLCDEMQTMYSFMFAVMLCTGMRIREAIAITHSNINREMKTLKIQSQIKDGRLVPAVKTRRGRKIRLPDTAMSYIEAAGRLQQRYESNADYHNAFGLVFTNENGAPLSYTNLNRKLAEIALRLHRPDLTNHTLRHTYMTVSARCGENLDEIQNEVGHGYASDVITEYLHQTDDSRHESAVKRQEYLTGIMERYGVDDGS